MQAQSFWYAFVLDSSRSSVPLKTSLQKTVHENWKLNRLANVSIALLSKNKLHHLAHCLFGTFSSDDMVVSNPTTMRR